MSLNVYAWPPVGVTGSEWTLDAPVSVARSALTGREYVAAWQPRRRMARLDVSALAGDRMAAGYLEVLKRLLDGVHLVRLTSTPINWHWDVAGSQAYRQSQPLAWNVAGWSSGGGALRWYSGRFLPGSVGSDAGWPAITVSRLPPGALVARPGEWVTVYADDADVTGITIMVMAPAQANDAGVAVIRLMEAAPFAYRVNLGTQETAVFRITEFPRAVQPMGQDWSYGFAFREVFADEVGGFVEIDPWH